MSNKKPPPGCTLITEGPNAGKYRVDDLDALMRTRVAAVSSGWDVGHCVWCNGLMVARPGVWSVCCSSCGERHTVEPVDGGGKVWRANPDRSEDDT